MTPAFQEAHETPLNLPALTSCLHCHVSGMQPPLDGTENRYPSRVFSGTGVSCERCHGPGAAHVGGGPIVNPAKLSPERRDAVCMQCHLEGKVAIERPGRHVYEFRPGDSLSDYIRYYVLAGTTPSGLGAVSQIEALAQSMCKKKSGNMMSCTNCHSPHYSPSTRERVSYYREKCLACHGAEFAAKHSSVFTALLVQRGDIGFIDHREMHRGVDRMREGLRDLAAHAAKGNVEVFRRCPGRRCPGSPSRE